MGPEAYASALNGSSDVKNVPYLGWNYPTEYQHMIHQHWRGFPKPEIYYSAFLFIAIVALMLMSLFGNGLVIWIFSTSKNLRTPSNFLIINLSIFDLVMLLNMPQFLVNTSMGYFVGGELACNIYAVAGSVSGLGAAITNGFIAFDRYRTISNPIDGRLNFLQVGILIVFTWMWSLPYTVLPFSQIWGRYIPEGFLTACSFDYLSEDDETRFFIRSMFVWGYCIPMVLICTYYTKLFLHVRDHEKMLADQAKKMNVKSLSANDNNQDVELRIAKAAMLIYVLYIVAWTPYATVAMVSTFGYRHLVTPFVSMLPAIGAKTVSCLDPWVYAASHPKYRLELERRLPWLGIRERSGGGPAANSGQSDASNASETGTVAMDR